ncbi:50S ribosomal protein L15 [Candidatus Nitrospira neomarina]|jgi:large subunit ribosomal protein L15|uniref:Large ribosomal subunit protein uL15 n=1 Tax=Candidatus Nitrospira neomarina TaxID=3020899 RepID=A0AA96GIP9_9BACT|nr:50S ribosomal protein L15 [Candidatus Nitrospira neomarina]WNM61667.1 50S ribosomal protein L15 [Candidatus Nitrospira neomarina]
MKLHDLHPSPGSKTKKKRLGRGPGSGLGKTAGKGHKGLLARSGRANQAGFEGGQMPLARRLPKRGFTNIFRIQYSVVNLKDLVSQENTTNFNPTVFKEIGLTKGRNLLVKILGTGEIDRPIVVEAHKFSDTARQKIENAGGQVKVIGRA